MIDQPADYEEFWMVKRGSSRSNPPEKVHRSYASARQEAERLAVAHPEERFFILHAGEYAVARAPALVYPTKPIRRD